MENLDPVEKYYRLKREKKVVPSIQLNLGPEYKSPLLGRFENERNNFKFNPLGRKPIKYGTYVEKHFPLIKSNCDIEVLKFLRIKNGKLVTAIRKEEISELMKSKYDVDFFDTDTTIINPSFYLLKFYAIHSYSPMYYKIGGIFWDNFVAKAIIPKGSYYTIGIDSYTEEVSYISDKLYIPKIEIIDLIRESNRMYYVVKQGNDIQTVNVNDFI